MSSLRAAALATLLATTMAFAAPEPSKLTWLNVSKPIDFADLRGRIVLLDFWTLGCINCLHVIPALRRIEEKFPEEVVVIGVHSPKFPREQSKASVTAAIARYDVRHPVVHDPEMTLWNAYEIRAWPTLLVLGPDGKPAGRIEGEAEADALERAIGAAVAEMKSAGRLEPKKLDLALPPPPKGRFSFPGKIRPLVVGGAKRWYLADAGHHQVVELDDAGQELRRFGSGEPGREDGAAKSARFHGPQGVAPVEGAVFVADTMGHAIRRIDLASGEVETIAGIGKRGGELGEAAPAASTALASPWDLVVAGSVVYFANAGTHQLGALDLGAKTVRRLAGSSDEGIDDGPAAKATLAQPSGLALSADGKTLWFADAESSAVRRLSLGEGAEVETLVGKGLFDFGREDGAFAAAKLQHPLGVAIVGESLVVADTYNSTLRTLDLGRRTVAEYDGGKFTCQDPVCVPLSEPAGIHADGPERLLVVDTNNHRVEEYLPAKKSFHTWAK